MVSEVKKKNPLWMLSPLCLLERFVNARVIHRLFVVSFVLHMVLSETISTLLVPRLGELQTQKLKSHLYRRQILKVLLLSLIHI